MDVVQQFNEQTYDREETDSQVFPIDDYEIPGALLRRLRRYRILKVPLMGQRFKKQFPDEQQDWCGRTSASMLYNYDQLVKGGNPKDRYITHWNAGKYSFMDLRLPTGSRAFHKKPDAPPFDRKLSGVNVSGKIEELWSHYEQGFLLPYRAKNRIPEGAAIAASEARVREHFDLVIKSIDANNPVIFNTGFSQRMGAPGHLILAVGYAFISQGGRDALWIVMADPSEPYVKIEGAKDKKRRIKLFRVPCLHDEEDRPCDPGRRGKDYEALDRLSDEHNLIRIINGDWNGRQGSLMMIRARHFFEQNPHNNVDNDLLMDDFINVKGGRFQYSLAERVVPDAVVVSSDKRAVCLPFDRPDAPRSPIDYLYDNETSDGGFYPLGLYRNLHSGVHLVPPAGHREVRVIAAGQIVAVRLAGAMPPEVAEGQGDPERGARSEALSGTSNAMVLVRHRLALKPEPTEGSDDGGAAPAEAEVVTFYTLYMHLLVPDWSSPDGLYARVPWLNTLLRRRGGSLSMVDPPESSTPPTLWPVAPQLDSQIQGGEVEVYGERFIETSTVSLGEFDGRVRAVAKPPDEDVQETLQALADGKVVTFAPDFPDMAVRRGDLVGFVPSTSAIGPGFLHFEVVTPVNTGVSRIVEFAEQRLKITDLFKRFEEQSDDNYFNIDSNDLTNLKDLLPEQGDGVLIGNDYGQAELQRLMHDSEPLLFAVGAEPQADEALVYPSTLRVRPYAGSVPPGDYSVSLVFRGRGREKAEQVTVSITQADPVDVEVMVPAWATEVDVTSDGFDVQTGGPPPTLEDETAHFRRIAAARWRNVKVWHLNEWNPAGLETSLKARFEGESLDLESLVDAMAWWGHDEEPVVGAEGTEPSLFVDGGEEHQLPLSAEIEHIHPVMFTWMLELLIRHQHAAIADPLRAAPEAEPTAAGWAGWLPARSQRSPRTVGGSMAAVVVSEASPARPSYGQVRVDAVVEGGPTVRLGQGPWQRDMVRVGGPLQLWGSVRLSVEGSSPEPLGAEVLEVVAPVIGPRLDRPQAVKTKGEGPWRLRVPFRDGAPRSMMGWVTFKTWTGGIDHSPPADAVLEEARVAIPVQAKRPGAGGAELEVRDGYVVGGPADVELHVTDDFTWSEWQRAGATAEAMPHRPGQPAPPPPPLVCESLVYAVQAVRSAYGYRTTILGLSEDKLSVWLKGANPSRLEIVANDEPSVSRAAIERDGSRTYVRVWVEAPEPGADPGVLEVDFDPAAAYAALLDELLPAPEQRVHVYVGVRFYNGGSLVDPALGNVEELGAGVVADIDWEANASAAGGPPLERFAGAPSAVLSRPSFGAGACTISGRSLVVSVPLHGGDLAMWKRCAPTLEVEGKQLGRVVWVKGAEPPVRLTASLALGSSRYKAKALSIVPKVTKAGVTYGEAEVAISDGAPIEYDTTPRVESVTVLERPGGAPDHFEVEAQTYGIPTDRSLELWFEAEGIDPTAWALVPVHYPMPDDWGDGTVTGLCDQRGLFRASVAFSDLSAVLKPDDGPRAFTVKVGRRWGDVLGTTVETVTAPAQLPAPAAEEAPEPEPGPVEGGMNHPEDP